MDIFRRGKLGNRGERTLLEPADVREFELKRDSDEILRDNRELLERGLVGESFVWDGSSRTRDDRSVNGLVSTLSRDCKL